MAQVTPDHLKYKISNFDLENFLDGKCNVWVYKDIRHDTTLNEMCKKYGCCIILAEGHWYCIIRHPRKHFEFFCSSGTHPERWPKMIRLLYGANASKVEYNEHKLQSDEKDINTCGRHCAVRITFRKIPLQKYVKMLKSTRFTPDEVCTYLTIQYA